ncbi:tRNA lysidine(34) synthetase TilS [Nubsella zeaxanthinifaciens]|uniref:tRNA lysidine(34) synthetase TilS n=1 Tax=Nubsella zeaxanthinifaciens TaxID=392412 RepID=UPI003D0420F3
MLPLKQFTDYITQQHLFNASDHVLLGVSGGKDSVLMAQLFKLAGFHFSIAHCNFNLRADEAQRDEAFVKLLAQELEVPFHVVHFDTENFAKEHKISIQMAARQLRYQWFEETRKANGYQYIAVAHHQNDAIETVLLNLVRGTGVSGMHGILPKRENLIRPLLFFSRLQIDELVEEHQLPYVEDSSNESSKYARNKIRLQVVPHLKEINPSLEQTFEKNITRFKELELLLQQAVKQVANYLQKDESGLLRIKIEDVQRLSPQKLLFYELLKPFHFAEAVVEEILFSLNKPSGTSFYSATHCLTIDRSALILSPIETAKPLLYLHGEGRLQIGAEQLISLSFTDSLNFKPEKNFAYVDASLLIFPLVVRYWESGDRFKPLGMKSFKKLSDFFVDEKVPLPVKDRTPLLINGNGEMIWIMRMRQDERYKLSATTKKVAIFHWH